MFRTREEVLLALHQKICVLFNNLWVFKKSWFFFFFHFWEDVWFLISIIERMTETGCFFSPHNSTQHWFIREIKKPAGDHSFSTYMRKERETEARFQRQQHQATFEVRFSRFLFKLDMMQWRDKSRRVTATIPRINPATSAFWHVSSFSSIPTSSYFQFEFLMLTNGRKASNCVFLSYPVIHANKYFNRYEEK